MNNVPRKLFLPRGAADTLSIHPLAKGFPPLSVKEVEALVGDIESHGLREAITLYEGQILDGVHRYSACCKAKVEPWAVDFEGDRAAAVAFVISKNTLRRHLTPAGKPKPIKALLQVNPEKSDRQIAKVVQASPTTVGATRKKMEAAGDVSKLDTRRDTKGRRQVSRKPRASNRATKKGRKSRAAAAPASISTTAAPISSTTAATAGVDEQNLVATLCDEKRQLETKCCALEGEVKDLKEENAALKAMIAKFEAENKQRKAPSVATVEPAPTATDINATPSNSIDGWHVKFKRYPAGWFWSAINENVTISSKPGALFATHEEAEANVRAAIAGAKEKAA